METFSNQLSQAQELSVRYHVISMETARLPAEKYVRHENRKSWKLVEKITDHLLVPCFFELQQR